MSVEVQTAYLYVLRHGDSNLFKIGRSVDLARRMKQLATGNPDRLTLFDCIVTEDAAAGETYLLHRLRSRRSRRSDATEFVEVAPDELETLIADTRAFLGAFIPMQREAERLASHPSDDRILLPNDAEWEWYRALLEVREGIDSLTLERRRLEAELKVAIGSAGALKGIATWASHSIARFDQESFRQAEPESYKLFVVEEYRRQFRLQ